MPPLIIPLLPVVSFVPELAQIIVGFLRRLVHSFTMVLALHCSANILRYLSMNFGWP